MSKIDLLRSFVPSPLLKKILVKKGIRSPFKDINDKYRTIFIHIPKCAGISIEDALFNKKIGHSYLWHYQVFDKERFNKYFKFTFVRNPWDRLVSAYFFMKKGGRNPFDKKWAEQHLSDINSFQEFVEKLNNKNFRRVVLAEQHFRPQYKYVCDYKENILTDFTGRLENIEKDFDYVSKRLGINAKLPHFNKSKKGNYKNYYNYRMKQIVANIYKKDIKLFNYKFE